MIEEAISKFTPMRGFVIKDNLMRYNEFVPRVYNWAKSMGFEKGKIMPSIAFCSDESQGFPVIMVATHFGAYPFNHGMIGGIMATGRHRTHASHGRDLVIIQACHVGYNPETGEFGAYKRLQSTDEKSSPNCGRINYALSWYQNEYNFMQKNVLLHNINGEKIIIIDSNLFSEKRDEGLFLHLEKLIEHDELMQRNPVRIFSTAKAFTPTSSVIHMFDESLFYQDLPHPVGDKLPDKYFYFKRNVSSEIEGKHHLEYNLMKFMPRILTSHSSMLTAAQIATQIEFDRAFRSIVKENYYKGRRLIFISGLNIDISPKKDHPYPMTRFVPWAAHVKDEEDNYYNLEQSDLVNKLLEQSCDNPDQIVLDDAIKTMECTDDMNI